MGPSPTPARNTAGDWDITLVENGNGYISTVAYDGFPADAFNLLMFICFEGSIAALVSWELPFNGGQYNQQYRLTLGHSEEGGGVEQKVEQWSQIRSLENEGEQTLTTYFQDEQATLQEFQRWGIVGVQAFDLEGNRVGSGVFRLGGLSAAIEQVQWGC